MNRSQLIKTINTARHALGWDDDLYRDTLVRFGGRADADGHVSLKSLNDQQMQELLKHQRNSGFKPLQKDQHGRKPNNLKSRERGPKLQKIEALLTDAGLPWGYVKAMARRMYKRDALDFCSPDELDGLITALDRAALKRLQADLEERLGDSWGRQAQLIAALLFGFPMKRDVTRYTEFLSGVVRWLRGEIAPSCDWPRQES